MKEKENKDIENLIEHLMSYDNLETPSKNFNDSVMAMLKPSTVSTYTTYKPLISKKTLVVSGLGVILLVLSPFVFGYLNQESWFTSLNDLSMPDIDLRLIPTITVPNIILYSIVLFMAMFGIQIASLKNRFENSIS